MIDDIIVFIYEGTESELLLSFPRYKASPRLERPH